MARSLCKFLRWGFPWASRGDGRERVTPEVDGVYLDIVA